MDAEYIKAANKLFEDEDDPPGDFLFAVAQNNRKAYFLACVFAYIARNQERNKC